MGDFVDSPVTGEFQKQGSIPEGSAGVYDETDCPPFNGYKRTSSPNGVKEKFYERSIGPTPSGEADQF